MRTVVASAVVLLAFAGSPSQAAAGPKSDRGADLPTARPLATVGPGGSVSLKRLDPLSLTPVGPTAELGEYHRTYSYSPDGSAIAFGISAPGTNGGVGTGRVGIRLVDSRKLSIAGNVRTGVYAAALAWLQPRRLVAVLGIGGVLTGNPPQIPDQVFVVTVDPTTGLEVERRELPVADSPFICGSAEVREQALIAHFERRLFILAADGDTQTILLPRAFARCGELVLAPGNERAFVVAPAGKRVAEVALDTSQLTVHRLPGRQTGEVEAVALTDRRLLLARRSNSGRAASSCLTPGGSVSRRSTAGPAGCA